MGAKKPTRSTSQATQPATSRRVTEQARGTRATAATQRSAPGAVKASAKSSAKGAVRATAAARHAATPQGQTHTATMRRPVGAGRTTTRTAPAKVVARTPARNAPAVPISPPSPVRPEMLPVAARQRLSKHELRDLHGALLTERARLSGLVSGLREQSLVRHDEVNHEEDGTDAFIRLLGLDRASSEQSRIVKIDAAIRAIEEGVYGICERCGCRIEKPRLQALPFAKTCIRCQSEAEGGHRGRVSARHLLWE